MALPKNHNATLAQTDILNLELKAALIDILNDIAGHANDLYGQDCYLAIQDGVIGNVPDDLGVVRASAVYSCRRIYTPLYKNLVDNRKPIDADVAQFQPVDFYSIGLTISIPLFGQITATAKVTAGSQKPAAGSIVANYEGATGTLWFNPALDIINKVKSQNLLANPQFKKLLEA